MALKYVQSVIRSVASGSATQWPITPIVGNMLVSMITTPTGTTVSAAVDGGAGALTQATSFMGANFNIYIYYLANISTGSSSGIALTLAGGVNAIVNNREYSGMAIVAPILDKNDNTLYLPNTGTSLTPTTPNLLIARTPGTLNNQCLLLSAAAANTQPETWSVSNGFGNLDAINHTGASFSAAFSDQIVNLTNTPTNYSAAYNITTSTAWQADIQSMFDFPTSITPKTVVPEPTTYWS